MTSTAEISVPIYPLPVQPERRGQTAHGFLTPACDRGIQKMSVPARRVIPIVFLPGIMGSSLRMSADRQKTLKKSNNIAWRPDHTSETLELFNEDAATRQRQLDPRHTEVDTYDPIENPTGNARETADQRHVNALAPVTYGPSINAMAPTPLLMDDPPGCPNRKSKEQKTRTRGWGEVYYGSYGTLLQMCELRLNAAFRRGKLERWWDRVVGVDPATWQAVASGRSLEPLTEEQLRLAVSGCWFPVHAMGYNWLRSNRDAGIAVAERIKNLIAGYRANDYQCEKVIVVTHSMGGLVARALIHPEMGNAQDLVLGVVHGVMPSLGAAAAYKRMRCGFEDSVLAVTPKILGNYGDEVTAVLGNSPGGLELLPNKAYGNDWLIIRVENKVYKTLPQRGDPYDEIYKLQDKWYGLIREEWLNPAEIKGENVGFARTCDLLDGARTFHDKVIATFHPCSFGHYGVDPERRSWHRVCWQVDSHWPVPDIENARIIFDSKQGRLRITDPTAAKVAGRYDASSAVWLLPASDPGDETVPAHSADHQLHSGSFKGIFRQAGYEHQASYSNPDALACTAYSIVRIASTMAWGAP